MENIDHGPISLTIFYFCSLHAMVIMFIQFSVLCERKEVLQSNLNYKWNFICTMGARLAYFERLSNTRISRDVTFANQTSPSIRDCIMYKCDVGLWYLTLKERLMISIFLKFSMKINIKQRFIGKDMLCFKLDEIKTIVTPELTLLLW